MSKTQTPPTESIKQTTDIFTAARSVWKRRKSLREKAEKLLADAPPRVKAIVEGLEAEEAVEPALLPSSPSATRDAATQAS